MNIRIASILSRPAPVGCGRFVPCGGRKGPSPWAAPPLEKAVSIRDGRTGELLSLDELLEGLAEADAVFLGETHNDETTHRVELVVYDGLLARRDGNVTLAMEMFERDVQQTLDDSLAGEIPEEEFLAKARPWSNYRAAYRPLIETAKAAGKPVIASNVPRPLLRRVAAEGPEVLESLEGDEQRQAPEELLPNTDAYCRLQTEWNCGVSDWETRRPLPWWSRPIVSCRGI